MGKHNSPKNTKGLGWAWVKYELEKRGLRIDDIATELGVSRHTIYSVRRQRHRKVERALAETLGVSVRDIWPERYEADVAEALTLTCTDIIDTEKLAS